MFSIGEFSKISGLTVKTLRFYHEEGLLVPACIDPQSGYRYYDERQIETARTIAFLRSLELPLGEIAEILRHPADEASLAVLERHRESLQQKIKQLRKASRSLDQFIHQEKEGQTMANTAYEVQEKTLSPLLVAGIRMRGHYSDCGKSFARLGRALGRHLCGKPLMLHYDTEYREDDADFEACMPIRPTKPVDGISMRELPGGRCVSLLHQGPYEQLGHSYAKVLRYAKEKGYKIVVPTREIYHKGPGMLFKGNPKNYLTEIEMLVE